MTNLLEKPEIKEPSVDDPAFSHYVKKDKIVDSTVFGVTLTALCGRKFVAQRNPERYPVCPECKDIYDNTLGINIPNRGD